MTLSRRDLLRPIPGAMLAALVRPAAALAEMDPPTRRPPHRDGAIHDTETKRTIRFRVRLPASERPAPLIIYSPGLGSGLGNGAAWCEAWRRAGFVVVTLAHPVTDECIWDQSRRGFLANLSAALSNEQYALRVKDCRFVIRHCIGAPGTADRIDPQRIGIAGHSYGALTVQALAREPQDLAIKAAIAFSPGARSPVAARQMVLAKLPFFCVTGDRDNHVTFHQGKQAKKLGVPLRNRIAVYENLPRGAKQLLVLAEADHMSFAGESVDPRKFSRDITDPERSDPKVWQRVNDATTLFWQQYLDAEPKTDRAAHIQAMKARLLTGERFEAG